MRRRPLFALAPLFLAGVLAGSAAAQTTSDRITVLTDQHGYYPCMDCHGDQVSVPTPRVLEEEHAEPLAWTDNDGQEHAVAFGERVALAELLSSIHPGQLHSDKIAGIGQTLDIERYMDFNGLAPEDSVWVMVHGGGNIWCLNCHHDEDRNKLVKLNGETITFNQSHQLCGGCHGSILADWDRGIHGKATGFWDLSSDEDDASMKMLCVECHNPHAPAFASMTALSPPVPRIPQRGKASSDHGDHPDEETGHE